MEMEPFFGFFNRDHRESAFAGPTAQCEKSESAASERRADSCEDNARKRKATPRAKVNYVGGDGALTATLRRCRREVWPKAVGEVVDDDATSAKRRKEEAPKQDYIHVRARRGQATDSHSLAERVRREKISERMKFLQDLVPGCDKVTGKAVMLDEIINYVQSLQRQVEFLSMKLSTVIPRPDFDVDTLLVADMNHPRGPIMTNLAFPTEAASVGFPYVDPSGTEARRSAGMQLPNLDGFVDASVQLGAFWEDDLQSVVQMGFGQNQVRFDAGSLPTPKNRTKIEL